MRKRFSKIFWVLVLGFLAGSPSAWAARNAEEAVAAAKAVVQKRGLAYSDEQFQARRSKDGKGVECWAVGWRSPEGLRFIMVYDDGRTNFIDKVSPEVLKKLQSRPADVKAGLAAPAAEQSAIKNGKKKKKKDR